MLHMVPIRNLHFSVEDVKRAVKTFHIYAELKPGSYKPRTGAVIKAAQHLERFALDFK